MDITNNLKLLEKGFQILIPLCYPVAPSGGQCNYKFVIEIPKDWDLEGGHDVEVSVSPHTVEGENIPTEKITFKLHITAENPLESKAGVSVSILIFIIIIIFILVIIWRRRNRKRVIN